MGDTSHTLVLRSLPDITRYLKMREMQVDIVGFARDIGIGRM